MKFAEFKMPKNGERFDPYIHLRAFDPQLLADYVSFSEIKNQYKQLLLVNNAFKDFIKNFNSLSNMAFFESFRMFYRVPVDKVKQDILTSMFKKPKKYVIKSNDIIENLESEGHGRDFSWWREHYRAEYVVYAEDGSLDENKVYTKQEIKELAESKKIIVMGKQSYGKQIHPTKKQLDELKEIVVLDIIPYDVRTYLGYDGMDAKSKSEVFKEYADIFNTIRQNLSKTEVILDYKKFMKVFEKHTKTMKLVIEKQKQKIAEKYEDLENQSKELYELERSI